MILVVKLSQQCKGFILNNFALEKQAILVFNAGQKTLIQLGFEKQANDPEIVITFLEKLHNKENYEQ